MPNNFVKFVAIVLIATGVSSYGTYWLVLTYALAHHRYSPQLFMASAMAGLFGGGLVALITILILVRSGSSSR